MNVETARFSWSRGLICGAASVALLVFLGLVIGARKCGLQGNQPWDLPFIYAALNWYLPLAIIVGSVLFGYLLPMRTRTFLMTYLGALAIGVAVIVALIAPERGGCGGGGPL
jgi:hypothetical protein